MSRRVAGDGSLTFDEARGLWVGRLPRSLDPRRRAVYGRTQKEARDKLRRASDALAGGLRFDERVRLGTFLDAWLQTVRARVADGRLAPRTAQGYESHVRLYLRPRLGTVPLRLLNVSHVEGLLGELQAGGLSAGTARSVRATLSRALTDAMRDELIGRNVAQIAEPPRLPRREPSTFTAGEVGRIVAACAGDRLGPLFRLALCTGLRASELRGLRWADVGLDAGTIRVSRGSHYVPKVAEVVTGQHGLIESPPKTEASGDRLPLSRAAVTLLRDHRRAQAAERLRAPAWAAPGLVFTTGVGSALYATALNRAWRALLARAGVPDRTADGQPRGLHELRRTFATNLRSRGVALEDVQRLGRWASPQVLLTSYAASPEGRLRDAAEQAAIFEADADAPAVPGV